MVHSDHCLPIYVVNGDSFIVDILPPSEDSTRRGRMSGNTLKNKPGNESVQYSNRHNFNDGMTSQSNPPHLPKRSEHGQSNKSFQVPSSESKRRTIPYAGQTVPRTPERRLQKKSQPEVDIVSERNDLAVEDVQVRGPLAERRAASLQPAGSSSAAPVNEGRVHCLHKSVSVDTASIYMH